MTGHPEVKWSPVTQFKMCHPERSVAKPRDLQFALVTEPLSRAKPGVLSYRDEILCVQQTTSFTIQFHMQSFRPVAIAVAICLALITAKVPGFAQASARSTEPTTSVADDQSFAGYQRVSPGITPPKATKSPDPPYPDLPVDTEPRGVVVMMIGVDTHGHVGPVQVVRSSAPVFEKSAVATVKTWKFKPAKRDGKPVPVQITVEMSFSR